MAIFHFYYIPCLASLKYLNRSVSFCWLRLYIPVCLTASEDRREHDTMAIVVYSQQYRMRAPRAQSLEPMEGLPGLWRPAYERIIESSWLCGQHLSRLNFLLVSTFSQCPSSADSHYRHFGLWRPMHSQEGHIHIYLWPKMSG
jgi:hypothetical protein